MSFIHTALLAGLGAILIPIIIHLLSRRAAKVMDWGAMQFLMESMESRKRRIQLEEALLMAARCLLAGLIALAVARPFVPPGSTIPWVIVLPAFLLAVTGLTTAVVLRGNRKWFWMLLLGSLAVIAASVAAVWFERSWNLKRFGTAGQKDIAIIIDASTSMQLRSGGGTTFDAALAEAREIVDKAGGGTAFSLIMGGPVPTARIPVPVLNRSDVLEALNAVKPSRGKMAAFDALAVAAVSLSAGSNPTKEIIVLTDGQSMGWEVDRPKRWDDLVEGWATMPSKPRVIFRRFPLPGTFRNLAVADVKYSREVIGTDRQAGIVVTVENTGTEAVTPGGLELIIGDKTLRDTGPGQLQPGARETVRFLHQFKEPGAYTVTARLKANDELAMDDEAVSVCQVVPQLGVLVVDGSGAARFMDRSSAFTALALAPSSLTRPSTDPDKKEKEVTYKSGVLMDPEVVPLSRLPQIPDLSAYEVIILADVPRLPESMARRLASWVEGGGGLLVLPGLAAQPAFYNEWHHADGRRVLPARLTGEAIPPEPLGIALQTLQHPALRLVADVKQSDLGTALMQRYWKLEPASKEGGSTGARLANGDPLLTSIQQQGGGSVILMASNFDSAAGTLASRQSFVVLVHQIVYHLANPGGQPLNREPAATVFLQLSRAASGGGMLGKYYKRESDTTPALIRIDPKPDFQWGNARPAPEVPEDFKAEWTGSLIPRYSEEYTFDGWGDDFLSLYIDGKRLIERSGEGRMTMVAGKAHSLRLEFRDNSGGAALQLSWRSQSQQREVIPSECLTPFAPRQGDTPEASHPMGRMDVTTPSGDVRSAELLFTRAGLVAGLSGDMVPGLYNIKVPKESRKQYARLLDKDGGIPFTIADDATESRLTPLNAADLTFMRQRVDLLEPASSKEVLNILAGREFGEELWKYLAVGALFFLLAEIALSRWIALSRRSGEEVTVDFEDKFKPSAQFQETLTSIRNTAS